MVNRAAIGALMGAVLLSVAIVSVHYGAESGPVSLMSECVSPPRHLCAIPAPPPANLAATWLSRSGKECVLWVD